MSEYQLKIGDLNKRIIIQTFSITVSDSGFETEGWNTYKTIWASATNLHGREFYSAMAVHSEKTIKFSIRYMKDLDTSMRILFDNKSYNITSIDNIKYGNNFMEIQALEVVL